MIWPGLLECLYFALGCVIGAIAVFVRYRDPFGIVSRLTRFWSEIEASGVEAVPCRYVVEGEGVRVETDDAREAKRAWRERPGSRLLDRGVDRTPRVR